MAVAPVVALEIGTAKVIALVGEMREDGHVMITGMGEQASAGVRKGEIVGFDDAVECVRAALCRAEENGKVLIRRVHLAVSGGHIDSMVNRGVVPVLDRENGVSEHDVRKVTEVARAVSLAPDRDVLHTICQSFSVDRQENVVRPEGMEGTRLGLDMLVIHGLRNLLRNMVKVVESVPIAVQDVAFSGLCSALSVLTAEQRQRGAVVIDLGAGTTDYAAYAEGVLKSAGAIGVGGDHITNDITLAFSIPLAQAERCKCSVGCAVYEKVGAAQKISLPPEAGFLGRAVTLRALCTVIQARMEETLQKVKQKLDGQGALARIGGGVVVVGGGAHLRGLPELAERVFGLPCSVGKPRGMTGLATATEGPQYAACSGLVQYGFMMATSKKRRRGLAGLLARLAGK